MPPDDPFDTGTDWLLDSRLRFTLFMVGLFALPTIPLLLWALGVLHA